jgi:hypothetical protein
VPVVRGQTATSRAAWREVMTTGECDDPKCGCHSHVMPEEGASPSALADRIYRAVRSGQWGKTDVEQALTVAGPKGSTGGTYAGRRSGEQVAGDPDPRESTRVSLSSVDPSAPVQSRVFPALPAEVVAALDAAFTASELRGATPLTGPDYPDRVFRCVETRAAALQAVCEALVERKSAEWVTCHVCSEEVATDEAYVECARCFKPPSEDAAPRPSEAESMLLMAYAILVSSEWGAWKSNLGDFGDPCCPECAGVEPQHLDECRLSSFLRAYRARRPAQGEKP